MLVLRPRTSLASLGRQIDYRQQGEAAKALSHRLAKDAVAAEGSESHGVPKTLAEMRLP